MGLAQKTLSQKAMDRFEWCDGNLYTGEQLVEQQAGVALYDGNEKVIDY